jgi:hypothetical protein
MNMQAATGPTGNTFCCATRTTSIWAQMARGTYTAEQIEKSAVVLGIMRPV